MQKWEYLIIELVGQIGDKFKYVANGEIFLSRSDDWNWVRLLNQLGDIGWELVASNDRGTRLTFKRPKP
ncbi:MAG TPA: hypothetical protein VGV38_16510 [Pyrinomonadaceae bacterium]|nr:hypothetical protein [Pyrinomonadaceae bacterium]